MSEPLVARVEAATPKTSNSASNVKVKVEPTEYQILVAFSASNGDNAWKEFGVVKARSANEAIKQAAGATPGSFIAVPARSWKPVTVKVEQTTRITLT